MNKLTKQVSVYLNSNVTQAFDRLKAHCDPDARALTNRIVSSAILFLDEQSSSGLMRPPRGVHPIPPMPLARNVTSASPASRSRPSRPSVYLLPPLLLEGEKHNSVERPQ